eukprot:CAMPEP_0198227308 /NCGR_PEP_ID=MMETSP1445-20131203/108707_1 /TAXON_ID=36898 /ORGANISM="Pyramimonas sp., Strain CCMP2087" /LENGTH=42 /DNA_ID= /DNA_START= /DNA_END= /DNA_ORIENTATION=
MKPFGPAAGPGDGQRLLDLLQGERRVVVHVKRVERHQKDVHL